MYEDLIKDLRLRADNIVKLHNHTFPSDENLSVLLYNTIKVIESLEAEIESREEASIKSHSDLHYWHDKAREYEAELKQAKADNMILNNIVKNHHNPEDRDKIIKLTIENSHLKQELEEEHNHYIETLGERDGFEANCIAYKHELDMLKQGTDIQITNSFTNPCLLCNAGWGTASTNGVTSCHDTCERFKEYHKRREG